MPSIAPHVRQRLLCRSDLEGMSVDGERIAAWLWSGQLEVVGSVAADNGAEDTVYSVNTEALRSELAQLLESHGRTDLEFSGEAARQLLHAATEHPAPEQTSDATMPSDAEALQIVDERAVEDVLAEHVAEEQLDSAIDEITDAIGTLLESHHCAPLELRDDSPHANREDTVSIDTGNEGQLEEDAAAKTSLDPTDLGDGEVLIELDGDDADAVADSAQTNDEAEGIEVAAATDEQLAQVEAVEPKADVVADMVADCAHTHDEAVETDGACNAGAATSIEDVAQVESTETATDDTQATEDSVAAEVVANETDAKTQPEALASVEVEDTATDEVQTSEEAVEARLEASDGAAQSTPEERAHVDAEEEADDAPLPNDEGVEAELMANDIDATATPEERAHVDAEETASAVVADVAVDDTQTRHETTDDEVVDEPAPEAPSASVFDSDLASALDAAFQAVLAEQPNQVTAADEPEIAAEPADEVVAPQPIEVRVQLDITPLEEPLQQIKQALQRLADGQPAPQAFAPIADSIADSIRSLQATVRETAERAQQDDRIDRIHATLEDMTDALGALRHAESQRARATERRLRRAERGAQAAAPDDGRNAILVAGSVAIAGWIAAMWLHGHDLRLALGALVAANLVSLIALARRRND